MQEDWKNVNQKLLHLMTCSMYWCFWMSWEVAHFLSLLYKLLDEADPVTMLLRKYFHPSWQFSAPIGIQQMLVTEWHPNPADHNCIKIQVSWLENKWDLFLKPCKARPCNCFSVQVLGVCYLFQTWQQETSRKIFFFFSVLMINFVGYQLWKIQKDIIFWKLYMTMFPNNTYIDEFWQELCYFLQSHLRKMCQASKRTYWIAVQHSLMAWL